MNDRFKYRIPMFSDKGTFIEFQYLELGDEIECTLCGYNGEPQQCIGLKDKNGKLIYEGDICKYKFEEIGEQKAIIYFSKELCSFLAKPLNDFQYTRINDCEVIGNIYENKEILKCQ